MVFGVQNGSHDFVITRAAAEISCTPVPNFGFGGSGFALKQGFGRHDETRCADATLQGGVLQKSSLKRM
jgi:hypothetical protein